MDLGCEFLPSALACSIKLQRLVMLLAEIVSMNWLYGHKTIVKVNKLEWIATIEISHKKVASFRSST